MGGNMKVKHKEVYTLDEQIEHLKINKRVVFDEIKEKETKDYLLRNNYINVITPFKHKYAKWDEGNSNRLKKDENGKHIYEHSTDFKRYVEQHDAERSVYPIIMSNINSFENVFSSCFSYYVLNIYSINSYENFEFFLEHLVGHINSTVFKNREKKRALDKIKYIKNNYDSYYTNFFNFFDSMSLGNRVYLYGLLPNDTQSCIYNLLKEEALTLGQQSKNQFDKTLKRLPGVRDTVYHCRSTTILVRYRNTKTNDFRKDTDARIYRNLIMHLSE